MAGFMLHYSTIFLLFSWKIFGYLICSHSLQHQMREPVGCTGLGGGCGTTLEQNRAAYVIWLFVCLIQTPSPCCLCRYSRGGTNRGAGTMGKDEEHIVSHGWRHCLRSGV